MTRRAIVFLMFLATATLGMTACDIGGGSEGAESSGQTTGGSTQPAVTVQTAEFRKAVKDASSAVQEAIDEPRQARNRRELRAALNQSAASLETVAGRLAQVEAPTNAQSAKDDLAEAMDMLATDLRLTAETVPSADLAQVVAHLSTIGALDDAVQAINDLQVAGVDVVQVQP